MRAAERRAKTELEYLVRHRLGQIVSMDKPARCAVCGLRVPAGPVLAGLTKPGKVCPGCVAEACMKELPQTAQDWGPEHVLGMLAGDPEDRIRGICACMRYGERSTPIGWSRELALEILPLGEDLRVFHAVLACAGHAGDTYEEGLVRMLACERILDVLRQGRMADAITKVSRDDPPDRILGAAEMIRVSKLTLAEKIRWISAFREHPDSRVVLSITAKLDALGVADPAAAEEILGLQTIVSELVGQYKLEELKALAKTLQSVTGEAIPGASKEALATGLARHLGQAEGARRFYSLLAPDVKRVVEVMAWQKHWISPDAAERTLGFALVTREKKQYYFTTVSLKPQFAGVLVLKSSYYSQDSQIRMHPWLRVRLKAALPTPEKARLRGTDEPPACADGRLFLSPPSLAGVFPAVDVMSQQHVIPRKQDGAPTLPGLRAVHAAGGSFEEFFPDAPDLALKRTQTLIALADAAPAVKVPRTKPAEVLKAWLDVLLQPGVLLRAAGRRPAQTTLRFLIMMFMDHLRGTYGSMQRENGSATCVASLRALMEALPPGKWVTIRDILEYMLYNDLDLPPPAPSLGVYVNEATQWDGRLRVPLERRLDVLWEEPLVRTFFLVLTAVGAVDAVLAPPRNPAQTLTGKNYLLAADGLHAIRLAPIGEWYFRGGPDDCVEVPEPGTVLLDEHRLLLRLIGSNPVLAVALEQVAQPLGSGFYRIDGGSFLRDCDSKALVQRKVEALRTLLPDDLPMVWDEFFRGLLRRINPLRPADYTVLEAGKTPEFRRLLLADPDLRKLFILAEGGHILVRAADRPKLKKRLKEMGYFIDTF